MAGNATLNGIPKRYAAIDPVQAPVIGSGMATKTTKVTNIPYFFLVSTNRFRVRAKSQVKNLLSSLEWRRKNSVIGLRKRSMTTTGMTLPIIDHIAAAKGERLHTVWATGIDARSSPIGVIATSNVASSGGND